MADPNASFNPDEYLKSKSSGISSQSPKPTPVDDLQLSRFDPTTYLRDKEREGVEKQQAEFGTVPEQALAGLEGAARGASVGASDYLEQQLPEILPTELGKNFTKEAIQSRQEANPLTAGAGNLAGSLIPGSAILKGARALGAGALAAEAAVGGAFGLGDAISESSLGDHDLNAEKLIAHVGMGAAFGGGLHLFGKAIAAAPAVARSAAEKLGILKPSEAAKATESLAGGALKDAGFNEIPLTKVEEASKFGAPEGQPLRESFPIEALNEADREPVLKGLNTLKPDADAIIQAGRDLGAPVPEGMLSSDDHIQKLDFALTNSPSPHGVDRNRLYNTAYEKASDSVSNALGQGTEHTLAETGNQAKKVLSENIEAKYQPIKDLYSQIEEVSPDVPVLAKGASASGKGIRSIIDSQDLVKGTPEHAFVETFANGIDQVDNLNRLKNFRTALDRATTPETKYVSSLIKDKLDELESQSVKAHAQTLTNPDAQREMNGLIGQIDVARKSYKGFRDEIGKIGKTLWGGKRIYGPQDFLDKIESETPEKFATRLFSKNNSEALQWMQKNHPEVTQFLSQFERTKIRGDSMVKGTFSPVKMLTNVNKLAPEIRSVIFTPEELNTFKAGKTYFDNFLPNFNPSGTAGALQYHEFLKNPSAYTVGWLKDFGIGKLIKHSVKLSPEQLEAAQLNADQAARFKGMRSALNQVTQKITQGAKAIFKSDALKAATISTGVQLSDSAYHKIADRINELASNPKEALDHLDSSTHDLHQAAPNTASSVSNSMIAGVQFLQSKMPQAPQQFPLSHEWKPSKSQINQFSKYYAAVNDPLHALTQVNNGTLNNETMEALQVVHPKILGEMRQNVMEHMKIERAQKLDYGKKLSLAKFLGQPLDGSMTSQMIQANQNIFNPPPQPAQPQPKKPRTNLGGLKSLKQASRTATTTNREEED